MTEEEAKTKWCPHIQVTSAQSMNDVEYGDNRGGGDENHNCIASDCMMWRLDEARDENMVLVPCDTGGHCGLTR